MEQRFWTVKEWLELASKEPRLCYLEEEIVQFRSTKKRLGTPMFGPWYDHFKPKLLGLVGHRAQNPELKTEHAYGVACHYLCDLLTERSVKPISSKGSKAEDTIGRQAEGH